MVPSRGCPRETIMGMIVSLYKTSFGAATENQIHCKVLERSTNATDVQDALNY